MVWVRGPDCSAGTTSEGRIFRLLSLGCDRDGDESDDRTDHSDCRLHEDERDTWSCYHYDLGTIGTSSANGHDLTSFRSV
jgi:hypothetical protein